MRNLYSSLVIAFSALLLNGCALQTRSASDLPQSMQTVHIESAYPHDQLTTQLTRQLQALKIRVVDSANKAPVTLRITSNEFTASLPQLVASASGFTYTYSLKTQFELVTRTNHVILQRSLSTSDSLIQNAQQLYTPNATALMKRELTHTMITLIYEQLITKTARKQIDLAVQKTQTHSKKHTAQKH